MAGLFKVVLTSTIGNNYLNPFVNVFGYRSNLAILNEEQELATRFTSDVLPSIGGVTHVAMTYRRVEVYNVSNGTGYYDNTLASPPTGTRPGDALPVFTAWGLQYNRISAGKRNGYKRFGLIAENDTNGDSPTATIMTGITALCGVLGSPIKVGLIDQWFPEILERKPTGVYPWTSHPILNVIYRRITTQNSRKR